MRLKPREELMNPNKRAPKREGADSQAVTEQSGLPVVEAAIGGAMAADVQTSGQTTSDGQGNSQEGPTTIDAAPIAGPSIRSRIDPASIMVDWNVEGLVEEDDQGPVARWGRPPRDNFVRAHPTWTTGVYLLDCQDSLGLGAEFVLGKKVAHRLIEEDEPVSAAQVYLMMMRNGGFRFWPVKLGDPSAQQKPSEYVKTAMAAIERARREWVKITWRSGKGVNGWRTRAARIELPEPGWPEDPMALFLQVVSDRYIDDPNDPVIRKYLGEA
jgi:hypothetical protein